MKNREPFDMKPLLFVFNGFIVVFNFWMAWEVSLLCSKCIWLVFVPILWCISKKLNIDLKFSYPN